MSIWRRLFRTRRMDAELDEELRVHLSMAQRDRLDRGESEAAANVSVRREFGNTLLVKETTRDTWGWTALENLVRDLRHALRQLKKHPGFTAVAIGTLALGIGSTTAMFSVVKGVLLEPLQYRDPSRLFLAYAHFPLLSWQKGPVNARHFHEWRTRCRACESVALLEGVAFGVAGRGEPRRVPGLRVSANLFRTLGVVPALGRDFLPEEELPGALTWSCSPTPSGGTCSPATPPPSGRVSTWMESSCGLSALCRLRCTCPRERSGAR